jgi:hypothetical protein
MRLVTPPSPFVSPEAVVGMAVYTARAMLHGKGNDVWEMLVENIPPQRWRIEDCEAEIVRPVFN